MSNESRRRKFTGAVIGDKMAKTATVSVEQVKKFPKLQRFIRWHRKFLAHNDLGAHVGDTVMIEETRPLSRHKRWRVVEVLKKIGEAKSEE